MACTKDYNHGITLMATSCVLNQLVRKSFIQKAKILSRQLKKDIKFLMKDIRRPEPKKDKDPAYQRLHVRMESRRSYPRRVKAPKNDKA